MAYEHRRVVRFEEVDFARIVYFPRLFGYCHNAFEDFFRDEVGATYPYMLQTRRVGYPAVSTSADFQAPLRFGDAVRIVMETARVGKRSVTCRYRLYSEERGDLCAQILVVTAAISMDEMTSVDLPDDVRDAFERHLIDEDADEDER